MPSAQLDKRKKRYVKERLKGVDPKEAALAAGFTPHYAKDARSKLDTQKEIYETINLVRELYKIEAKEDLAKAVEETEHAALFAMATCNPMALVKAREHKHKLLGLVTDRVEITNIDLGAALELARTRIINITPPPVVVELPIQKDHAVTPESIRESHSHSGSVTEKPERP